MPGRPCRDLCLGAGLLGLLLASTPLSANKLYQYQDEQGRWHYTDLPPAQTDAPAVRPAQQVVIDNTGSEAEPEFTVTNSLPGPIELEFRGEALHNLRADPPLPLRLVIPAYTRQSLTRLRLVDPGQPGSYRHSARFVIGDPQARHLPGKPYAPPFAQHRSFDISGVGNPNPYGVMLDIPADTTVHAARSGIVMEIKQEALAPGQPAVQIVRILHADGTFGVYGHLKPTTITVKLGQQLHRGEILGEVAQQARLYFAVQKNTGLKLESIPFEFTNFDGRPLEPGPGVRLRHPP